MVTLKAKVKNGRLKLDTPYDAPDGTVVDLAVIENGDALDDADRARLHEALREGHEQAAHGDVVPSAEAIRKLRAKRG